MARILVMSNKNSLHMEPFRGTIFFLIGTKPRLQYETKNQRYKRTGSQLQMEQTYCTPKNKSRLQREQKKLHGIKSHFTLGKNYSAKNKLNIHLEQNCYIRE
jgi:hypothetical protein